MNGIRIMSYYLHLIIIGIKWTYEGWKKYGIQVDWIFKIILMQFEEIHHGKTCDLTGYQTRIFRLSVRYDLYEYGTF
jgi:hypothetical protein